MSEASQSREEILALLRTFRVQHQSVYKLVALGTFGCFARGDAHSDSDVDIVFDTDHPNLFLTVMMKQDLEKLLGRSVDVLQLRPVTNPRLKARIERDAIYV